MQNGGHSNCIRPNRMASVIALLMVMVVQQAACNLTAIPSTRSREHKVHNIMLHPEKHSWCKSTPIKQIVSHAGCKSMEMENSVCVGACFSFSVPKTIPETPGDEQLHYCDSCQPTTVTWATVSLECPDIVNQPTVTKMVELIENCSCRAYGDLSHSSDDMLEQDVDVGKSFDQAAAAASSGEQETYPTSEDVDGGGVSRYEDEVSSNRDRLAVDLAGTDNNIPKFLELKDLAMMSHSAQEWNDTSLIEEGIFLRPINTTLRDSILKSPGHQMLLRQLQSGIGNSNDDDDDDDDDGGGGGGGGNGNDDEITN